MNKKFITLLGSVSLALVLAGCNGKTQEVSRFVEVAPTAIRTNTDCLSMLVGGEGQITTDVSPRAARYDKLSFTSLDTKVATVDNNGKVTGKSAGETQIKVHYTDGDYEISKLVSVIVLNSGTSAQLKTVAQNMLDKQKEIGTPSKVETHEVRQSYTLIGKERIRGYDDDCFYQVDVPDGRVNIDGYETRLKTQGGSLEDTLYSWNFYTDADYMSTIYHTSNSTKTRLSVATQSFIGQDRVEACYSLLDSLFKSGREIVVRQFENIYETEFLEDAVGGTISAKQIGVIGNEYCRFVYGGNISGSIDPEDESDYEIPANTKYRGSISYDMTWKNGQVRSFVLKQIMNYTLDGVNYTWQVDVNYSFKMNDDVNTNKPVNKDYRQVSDIFEL